MSGYDSFAGPLGEVRNISGTDAGLALTTTAQFVSFPLGTNYLVLTPNTIVTAKVIKWALNPWLIVLKTTDALATAGNITNGSENVQDNDTGTNLSMNSFDTAANLNFLYVGAHIPFRGVRVIIGNTNSAGGSALTVKYWKNDSTWASISVTDGTLSTDTFRQTGNATWTLPTDWQKASLVGIGDVSMPIATIPAELQRPLFWTRWQTSVIFDSSVTVTGMQTMNRSTTYGAFDVNVGREMRIRRGIDGHSCVEALTDAGTANLLLEAAVTNTGASLG